MKYKIHRHLYVNAKLLGDIYICHIMGNKIRVDATLRLGH